MKSANSEHKRVIIHAGAVCDAQGVSRRPAVIHLQGKTIIKIEPPPDKAIDSKDITSTNGFNIIEKSDCRVIDLQNYLILPALVNAHTHLDLTHIGLIPYTGNFIDWVEKVAEQRLFDETQIAHSVETGLELSQAGGTGIIGDIAGCGSLVPAQVLARSNNIFSVSFIEYFGQGKYQEDTIWKMSDDAIVLAQMNNDQHHTGLQPHALYSAGIKVYDAAVALAGKYNLSLSTHLSELIEEEMFTRSLSGPWVDFFKKIGKWDPTMKAAGKHPVDLLQQYLHKFKKTSTDTRSGWVTAHVNYADNSHLRILAESGTSVVYCPHASAYFGHKNHRYQDMLQCGINVALGTDSILCLDTPERISILDEMAFLYQRDNVDARLLLKMATVNGARALGFDTERATLTVGGEVANLIAVEFNVDSPEDPLEQVLAKDITTGVRSKIITVL